MTAVCLAGGFALGLALSAAADLGYAHKAEALIYLGVSAWWTAAR